MEMDLKQAMEARHAVREYKDVPLEDSIIEKLEAEIAAVNKEGDLNIQLFTNEPEAFDPEILIYGKIKNVKNYIAMIGKNADDLEERIGYYGERLVLFAQQLGLNSCWVGTTYKKMHKLMDLRDDDRIVLVIAIGYGENEGVPHKSKGLSSVIKDCKDLNELPEWFISGAEASLLAPTCVNQQRFSFRLTEEGKVEANPGRAFFCKIDMGIAKYHFELGAGKDSFKWA